MIKKSLFVFFATASMVLTGCGGTVQKHEAKTEWSHDTTYHWHDCKVEGCTEHKYDNAEHTWDAGAVTKQPTCIAKGEKTFTCTVCSATRIEEIPMTEHHFSSEWSKDADYHWKGCTTSGCTEVSEKAAHTWDAGKVTTEPTCHSKGVKTFTCTVCGQTKTDEIPMTEHDFPLTWEKNETEHWHVCQNEGCTAEERAAHTWDEGVITKKPSCTEAGELTYTCTVCGQTKVDPIDPIAHKNMEHVDETIPTHDVPGTLEHYYCPDCKGCFKDEDGLLPIADPSTLVITSPVISKTYTNANLGKFDTIDQKAGSGEKHKDGSGGYAAWFNINDEQGKGAVYVEAEIKLTKNAAYSDIGFIIATVGSTNLNRVVRAGLYIPDANNHIAGHARIRTVYEDAGSIKDQEEKRTALAANINVAEDFVKIAMYRKGSNVVFFVDGQIVTGMNMKWQKWANASDETVAYKYGIFGQNISDIFYQNAKFEYGDEATELYEGLAMGKIMPDTRTGSYGVYKYASGNKVWNDGTKTSAEAPFLTTAEQQVANTYVEGTFKAKANSSDTYASFGFMMTLANGTNNKGNIVIRPVLYIHNGDGLISGLKIKQVVEKADKSGYDDKDTIALGGVLSYGSILSGVKFAMYRAGTTVKLYINDQEVYSKSDDWTGSAEALGTAEQKMIYSIWQQNMTDTEASNLVIKTGAAADEAIAGLKTTGELDMAAKFGNYDVSAKYNDGGIVKVDVTASGAAKVGVFDRRLIKSSVYFEGTFKATAMQDYRQIGIMFVQTHKKDGTSISAAANQERFSVGLKNDSTQKDGRLTRLVTRDNSYDATGSDVTVKDNLGFDGGAEIKLAVYRNNEKIYIVLNEEVIEVPATSYARWADFADSTVGYNIGIFCDAANTAVATVSKISMLTGQAADDKIQSLLPQA